MLRRLAAIRSGAGAFPALGSVRQHTTLRLSAAVSSRPPSAVTRQLIPGQQCLNYAARGQSSVGYGRSGLLRSAQRAPASQLRTLYVPGASRGFHASARREALPLVPAVGALLKGTSLLALATGFSRILISFFPLGTLATLRMARGVTSLSKDKYIPTATKDAHDFWQLWCEDEKGIPVTWSEAEALPEAPETPNEGLLSPDGRVAHHMPLPKEWRKRDVRSRRPDEDDSEDYAKWRKKMIWQIRKTCFFLPPLPPASVKGYNELSTAEQGQVDALRRYWTSLRMFKDRLRLARVVVMAFVFIPILLLFGVWLTGLERVPFTGRWRLILLTPEEEEVITQSLEGPKWFKSVITLLTTPDHPAPPIVPLSDWRWDWVQSTLRRLEAGALSAIERIDMGLPAHAEGEVVLIPPPSKYPLRPRARGAAILHNALPRGEHEPPRENLPLGPPYNVLIMEAPDKNAFSYGFGGRGAGGIVIFTGLLDDILAHNKAPPPPPVERGFWERLLYGSPPPPRRPEPTEEQTLHLATILSHEMGHLLLSHHLETLSHQQVLWPSLLGLSVDLLRAFVWPITSFLGPAVNDALANFGHASADEMTKQYGHVGFEIQHEHEADLTALRLLAHAGYDPREAVRLFAGSLATLEELDDGGKDSNVWWNMIKLWSWGSHPKAEDRVAQMSSELSTWESDQAGKAR